MTEEHEEKVIKEEQEKWHHVATVEELDGLNRKIHIVYDIEGVKMAIDKAVELVGKRVQIKGFRRGKAPKPLIETHCKKEIENTASTMLSQEGYLHACYENKFHALSEPKVENAEFYMDGTFSCDILLEIRPSIDPTGYLGLNLEKEDIDKDSIVRRNLEDARKQHVNEVEIKEVEIESIVTLDFKVHKDGQELSSGVDHRFMINAGQEPPFGENLVGKSVGSALSEIITLPEEYKEIGGEQAIVDLVIKSIAKPVPPSDQELVERMSAPSLDELMDLFGRSADQEIAVKNQQLLEEQVIDKLLAFHEFEVPVKWVDDEEKYLYFQLGLQEDVDPEMKQHIRSMAERNVRRVFILDAIYDVEPSLKVQKEEFEQLLEQEAQAKGVSKLIVKKELQQKGMMDAAFGILKHKKVMNLILSQAIITTKCGKVEKNLEDPIGIPDDPLG